MIRKILVPVRGDGKGDNVLAHAAALALRSGAHVEVAHCRPRPEDMLPFGVPMPAMLREQLREQANTLADTEEAQLKGEFEALSKQYGLQIVDYQTEDECTSSWVEGVGKMVDVIRASGRLSDLICVAKPDRDRNLGSNTLKAALFNTGRPVMMCPPQETPPGTLGANITIAWNGSIEAVRAVVMMRRVIEAADTVTILGAGHSADGNSPEDYKDYLTLRGIKSTIQSVDAGRNAGAALLSASSDLGADLMIMGAYGDSHERETVFGGNTQTVVDTATMPVVMVH